MGGVGLALMLTSGDGASAQMRGAYLPLDHPAHPVAEMLVARGVLRGLDQTSRPFVLRELRASVLAARAAGGTVGGREMTPADERRLDWLGHAVGEPAASQDEWGVSVAPEVGGLGGTSAFRELMLADGDSAATLALRLRVGVEFGPVALQFEPQRVKDGRARIPLAVGRAEWRWGWLQWGEVERGWGPPGVSGLLISPVAGSRPELGFALGPSVFRFEYRSAPLTDGVSSSTGETVARYWAMHRLRWRPLDALEVAAWETSLSSEPGGPDAARASPFTPFYFPYQQGRINDRNATMGLDLSWWTPLSFQVEAQVLIDDIFRDREAATDPYPHRYGYVAQLRGPLGASLSWRAYGAALTNLALINRRPEDSYLDKGIPLGRLRPDHREAGAFVTVAWGQALEASGWPGPGTAELGVKWRRQGIRDFRDPWPDLPPGTPRIPAFSTEIEREVWAIVADVDWLAGPLTVQTESHLQYRRFPDAGGGWEWAFETLLEVVWRVGLWGWTGTE